MLRNSKTVLIHGQAKIKSHLCSMGGFEPDEWDFPPKPKWMRWKTAKRFVLATASF
jgi:hypothetical protein